MIFLNTDRAVEIINSKGVINVKYNNEPIWIESIDEMKGMAHVKNIKTNKSFNVSIFKLME